MCKSRHQIRIIRTKAHQKINQMWYCSSKTKFWTPNSRHENLKKPARNQVADRNCKHWNSNHTHKDLSAPGEWSNVGLLLRNFNKLERLYKNFKSLIQYKKTSKLAQNQVTERGYYKPWNSNHTHEIRFACPRRLIKCGAAVHSTSSRENLQQSSVMVRDFKALILDTETSKLAQSNQ